MQHPITIAGGGLAGLSLAIALRTRGVDVTLHEASIYPRHRVCGEFISGVAPQTLATLGIPACLDDAVPLLTSSWSDSKGLLSEMNVPGQGLSRHTLDDRLQRQFTALGGHLVTHSRIAPGHGIIWAAGRPRRKGPWLGIKCHARNLPLTRDLEMFTSPCGYIGLAKIGHNLVNICGLLTSAPGLKAKGPALLTAHLRRGGLHTLAERLEAADLEESSFCGVAGFQTGPQPGPLFSIGDASSMIPPFTGNGMTMAFESAESALEPALDYADGRKSWAEAAVASSAIQRARFRKRMAAAACLHALLTTPVTLRLTTALARRRLIPFQTLLNLVR